MTRTAWTDLDFLAAIGIILALAVGILLLTRGGQGLDE